MPFGQMVMKCANRPSIVEADFLEHYYTYFWDNPCYKNGCAPEDFHVGTDGKVYNDKRGFGSCPFKSGRPCEKFKKRIYNIGYATYKEALLIATNILEQYPDILRLVVNRFPYFIVDEAQDTSEEQMRILNLLFDNGVQNALLIGDPDQSIYEWRDADPSVFLGMYSKSGWNANELNENFRCSQNICNATKVFSTLNNVSIAAGVSQACMLKPMIVKYKKDEKDALIEKYLNLCRSNNIDITTDRVAVLTRGRTGLIGKDYSRIPELWKNSMTRLLALATYYKGIHNVEKTVFQIEKVLFFMIFNHQVNAVDYKEIQKCYSIKEWNRLVFELSTLLPEDTVSLKNWKEQIEIILNNFVLKNNIVCKNKIEIKTKVRVKDQNLKDFLEQPINAFFTDSYRKDYLNATIHAVKGCTFDAVMLIINTTGKLTSNMINQKEIDSEEIRTFYVAATRARKLFVLALPDTVKDKTLVRFPKELWDYL